MSRIPRREAEAAQSRWHASSAQIALLTSVACILFNSAGWAASMHSDVTATRFLEQTYPGSQAHQTAFPGIYRLSSPGEEDVLPMLVDAHNTIT
jgi:hypothetical protein